MKVVFFGGGGFRTLPIVRSALAGEPFLAGGEVYLYDINGPRAETMARMIRRTPEWRRVPCTVSWGTSLDQALDGADAVSVSMMATSPLAFRLGDLVSHKYGILSSDQISPNGAFLALKHGRIVLDLARRMERLCPEALLIVFCNPVPVVSGVVNLYTKIRALGICGGFTNHMWDLSRLMGRDELCNRFDVDVAGVNHLSFILRGTLDGRDLYEVLGEHVGPGWKPPRFGPQTPVRARAPIRFALRKLVEMYHRFRCIIFSTEGDGMAHLFYEEMYERQYRRRRLTRAAIQADIARARRAREQADQRFRALADQDLDDAYWRSQPREDDGITVRLLRAWAGVRREKIVASFPSRGAVDGFKHRTILEYSQFLEGRQLTPVPNLYVPDVFHGLITSLATHQTLLADAIGTEDPKRLYEAFVAYPIKAGTRAQRALWKELLAINKDEISPRFQQVKGYL